MPTLSSASLRNLATLAPKMICAVRGLGEAPRTIWVREYENGKQRLSSGRQNANHRAACAGTAMFGEALKMMVLGVLEFANTLIIRSLA